MMFFFELLLVSALTAYGNTKVIDPHECKGNSLCDVKPSDYPQEDIDNHVAENLHLLQRMRRSNPGVVTTNNTSPANVACVSVPRMINPYTLLQKDQIHELEIVFFSREIPETSCNNEGSTCLESIIDSDGERAICSTKTATQAVTFRTKANESLQIRLDINVDCVCGFTQT